MPALPNQFTLVLEAKLADTASATGSVFTVQWAMDAVARTARYDVFEHSDPKNVSSPIVVHTSVYAYTPGTPWGTQGTVLTGCLNGGAEAYTMCKSASIGAANMSPLFSLRSGYIPRLFSEPSFVNQFPPKFVQKMHIRGVNTDNFDDGARRTLKHGDITYTSDTDVLFFPQGWQFPGRNVSTPVPMRIKDEGFYTFTNASGFFNFTYSDTWFVHVGYLGR
jgi:hypothetical protein